MMKRDELINKCIVMTAELNGVTVFDIDFSEFESMSDEKLVQRYSWLCKKWMNLK